MFIRSLSSSLPGFMRSLMAFEREASDPTRLLSRRACAFLKSLVGSADTCIIDRSTGIRQPPRVKHRSKTYQVKWAGKASRAQEPLQFVDVEPGVGGLVELSDGSKFYNPVAKVSDRLTEAQERSTLCTIIAKKSKTISVIYENLLFDFDDVVTFMGRPYLDKMEKDYVEMLYELERERLGQSTPSQDMINS
jgi:hypothetical protein